nr:MAG TPA: hypothetical protein [Caudoviricetes sp.]
MGCRKYPKMAKYILYGLLCLFLFLFFLYIFLSFLSLFLPRTYVLVRKIRYQLSRVGLPNTAVLSITKPITCNIFLTSN